MRWQFILLFLVITFKAAELQVAFYVISPANCFGHNYICNTEGTCYNVCTMVNGNYQPTQKVICCASGFFCSNKSGMACPPGPSTTTTSTTRTTTTTTPTTTTTTPTTTTPTTTTTKPTTTTTTPTTTTTTPTTTTTTPTTTTTTPTTTTTTPTTTTTTPTTTTTTPTTTTTTILTTTSPYGTCHCGDISPNPKDCGSYITCMKDSCRNRVNKTERCPGRNHNYDPVNQICTKNYTCPYLPTPSCEIGDDVICDPNDPKSYYECCPMPSPILIKNHRVCPKGLVFDRNASMCKFLENVTLDLCNLPKNASDDGRCYPACLDLQRLPSRPFYETSICKRVGLFPDALDCNRYYVCREGYYGNLEWVRENCPVNHKFDVYRKKCSKDPNVKCLCTQKETDFKCEEPGVFEDPKCNTQYYACYESVQITFQARKVTCPGPLIFDADRKMCVRKIRPYIPPQSSVESEENISGLPSKFDSKMCLGLTDKYPCEGDDGSYFICINGYLRKQKCHGGYIFDKRTKKCCPRTAKKNLNTVNININV